MADGAGGVAYASQREAPRILAGTAARYEQWTGSMTKTRLQRKPKTRNAEPTKAENLEARTPPPDPRAPYVPYEVSQGTYVRDVLERTKRIRADRDRLELTMRSVEGRWEIPERPNVDGLRTLINQTLDSLERNIECEWSRARLATLYRLVTVFDAGVYLADQIVLDEDNLRAELEGVGVLEGEAADLRRLARLKEIHKAFEPKEYVLNCLDAEVHSLEFMRKRVTSGLDDAIGWSARSVTFRLLTLFDRDPSEQVRDPRADPRGPAEKRTIRLEDRLVALATDVVRPRGGRPKKDEFSEPTVVDGKRARGVRTAVFLSREDARQQILELLGLPVKSRNIAIL